MSEIQGREFDWFALDREGNLALFATSGEGYLPAEVVGCIAMHDAISESLPAPHTGTLQVWNDYAAQGLFVFDWAGRLYRRQAVPTGPITTDLRAKIMAIHNVPFLNVSFGSITELKQWPAT